MPKPKAPPWLREAFRDGVDDWLNIEDPTWHRRPSQYPCWLAPHDPGHRECTGTLERFHFIGRQRVEAAVWEQLREASIDEPCPYCGGSGFVDDVEPECCGNTTSSGECRGECVVPRQVEVPCSTCGSGGVVRLPLVKAEVDDLILVAAWDSRNAAHGCEHHHRRYDGHACSPTAPRIVIPYSALPPRVIHFAFDYGIDAQLDRFPSEI